MAHDLQQASRLTAIELLTRNEPLKAYEIRLLQGSLRDVGVYGGNLTGDFGIETGKAALDFLKKPENAAYIGSASDETRGAVKSYSDRLQQDATSGTSGWDRMLQKLGIQDTPVLPDPYKDMFGTPRPAATVRGLDAALALPKTLDQNDIETIQRGLKIAADGTFGRSTRFAVSRHLADHPADWATIGTPVLRELLDDLDSRETLQKVAKPKEYFDRVHELVQATKGMTGTNAQTYELQNLLNAGGFYRTRDGKPSFSTPDGGPGDDTSRAINAFEAEYKKPGRRADLGNNVGESPTQLADAGGPGSVKPEAEETARVATNTIVPPATKFSV